MALLLASVILIALVGGLYQVSFWASATNRTIEKLSAYECGLEPVGDARMKFDIQYYVIGILYQIFDLEIIFLFPQATVLFSLGSLQAFWVVMIFLIILTIGFLYEWFHGALEIVTFFSPFRGRGPPAEPQRSATGKVDTETRNWCPDNRYRLSNLT